MSGQVATGAIGQLVGPGDPSAQARRSHPPASTAVQVVALARPEFLLEVEALALAGEMARGEVRVDKPSGRARTW
ncbi:MAG: RidA family protein [Streptosporangiaceae bacterium]